MTPAADLTLIHLATELGARLEDLQWRLTTAESCTGGGVSEAITAIAGSSGWFDMGFVTYANHAKEQLLGVSPQCLEKEGAVSQVVAEQMALGAKKAAGANLAVAITGIAGPSGGTTVKPVGTVWFAWAWDNNNEGNNQRSECYTFSGDRQAVRRQAVVVALREMLTIVKKI